MRTKKILVPLTLLLVVFSFNLSYSQDVSIADSLFILASSLNRNYNELQDIRSDLASIGKVTKDQADKIAVGQIVGFVNIAATVYEYQIAFLSTSALIREDKLKVYCELSRVGLKRTKKYIDYYYESTQKTYPFLENKAALHTVDKVKKNLLDSLGEIESTMKVLDDAIKSIQ